MNNRLAMLALAMGAGVLGTPASAATDQSTLVPDTKIEGRALMPRRRKHEQRHATDRQLLQRYVLH